MAWNHAYRLTFGTSIPLNKLTNENGSFTKPIDIGANVSKVKNKANAYELTEHQLSFSISKDNNKEPNRAEITIVNASDNLVNYLTNNVKNSIAVVFDAGFEDQELKRLFSGTVHKVSDKKQGEDRNTRVTLKDGAVNVQESITSRSYPKGTKYATIMQDLSQDLGTPVGKISIQDNTTTSSPMFFVGSTAKNMNNIAASINHNFSIQDGAVYVTSNTHRFKNSVLAVTSNTGLIGSPEPLSMSEKKSKKNKNPGEGIKFTMALEGSILPETTIYVKSDVYDGYFKVTKVTHSGSYEEDQWTTDVEAVYVDKVAK